ncbi:hypothetical protein J0A67_10085 [Algoriphagus aestuariicola]|uniref:DUF3464 family protein n=1 Tax=Algoriphagus aestuariicola TaxID=1852016 RepID=A0ABS3BPJ2_9BACT|nr:hypothetical protein [Algoriphagus aestuariicola]MBN7801212.1 hypothetical protein [Algoriphagus aestuariicola]
MTPKILPILLTGMTLGTAWAIRGQFGHEQGAAWAGGIACVLLLVFARKKEWISGGLKAALLGAIGWGLGGMMSYGQLVGYGRMDDFPNVAYAMLMMFIVGGLYGFLGGGLFGLGLQESCTGKKIAWHQLLVEMFAGAVIFYYFVVEQLGVLMTPPRSEAWALCAGAAIALAYFCSRNGFQGPLKVAAYTGLGAGFGFGFGEFLLVVGNVSGLKFNFWNMMEYSLGFFGGIGMAYSALRADFGIPKTEFNSQPSGISWPVFGLLGLIPLIVWHQSFWEKDLLPAYSNAAPGNPEYWASLAVLLAFVVLIGLATFGFFASKKWKNSAIGQQEVILKQIGLTLFAGYLVYTFLITGSYLSFYRPEQFLYIVNFVLILALLPYSRANYATSHFAVKRSLYLLFGIVAVLVLLSVLAISTHDGLKGAKGRFGTDAELVTE